MFKAKPVTIGGDVDLQSIVGPIKRSAGTSAEEFRMQCSGKQVKAEIGNFWSSG